MATAALDALSLVLTRRPALLRDIARGEQLNAHWARLGAITAVGAAIYGLVLGSWRDSEIALYDAVKLPLVLLLTSVSTMFFHFVVARLLGAPLLFRQTVVLTALSGAISAVILGALAPVVALFTFCSQAPSETARTTYQLLYVVHFLAVGASSFVGTLFLWRTLRDIAGSAALTRRIYVAWIAVDALVGGEFSWVLRPFIGSLTLPVAFLRPDAFHGNVYEAFLNNVTGLLSLVH
jgi:hypothetical protein